MMAQNHCWAIGGQHNSNLETALDRDILGWLLNMQGLGKGSPFPEGNQSQMGH